MEPYVLHFDNDVDFSDIACHDLLRLERYAARINLSREGKHGPAATLRFSCAPCIENFVDDHLVSVFIRLERDPGP